MHDPNDVIELKAFLPAKDYGLSQRFYQDVGFTFVWVGDQMAYFHCGAARFMLQNFYEQAFAENLMMHLMVKDVDAWYARLADAGIAERYQVRLDPPQDQPWGIRDFVMNDPSGVLWRIGQEIPQ